LVPDFICEVVIRILEEYQLDITFYSIGKDFEFNLPKDCESYDALYIVRFFGSSNNSFIESIKSFSNLVIIDDVFSESPYVPERKAGWYSFNSLRKISAVSDMSFLYSNRTIDKVTDELVSFSELKYKGKHIKYRAINESKVLSYEAKYLKYFNDGEYALDRCCGIFKPSTTSILESLIFMKSIDVERVIRFKNYKVVTELISDIAMDIKSDFYSFAPIYVENRDEIIKKLRAYRVFLPVHWPRVDGRFNNLSDNIISIPLDSRYDMDDIRFVCLTINSIR
jgi:hypothetical protein